MEQLRNNPKSCVSTMKLLGDYWTLRVIDSLSISEKRFCELQRHLDNLNPVTLTSRLKKLEDEGLVTRTEDKIDKVSVSYCLTDRGCKAIPVLRALDNFAS